MSPDITAKQAQRLWPRWFVAGSKPVKVDLGPAGSGPLVDIGGGGFRVQSLAPLRRGAEVPVRIEVPEHADPLQCSGVVVWSKPNGAAGIRFAKLDEHQQSILQGWLGELERAATSSVQAQVQDDFTAVVSQIRGAQLNSADALNLIVRRAKDLSAVSGAAIALGKPESMTCMASAGEAPPVGATIPGVIGLAGECLFKRRMVHCEDSKNDPRVSRDARFGSAVILPLVVNGEARGIVEVFSKRSYAFTATVIDALEKLADAVVFVTHGIVTQRRLAATRPALPTGPSLGPKSSQPLSPLTAGFTPPVSVSATTASVAHLAPQPRSIDSLPTVSEVNLSSVISVKSAPVETVPIASSIAAPVQPLSKPKSIEWDEAPHRVSLPKPSPRRQPEHKHSTAKWMGLVVVLVTLVGLSGWYVLKNRDAHPLPLTTTEASTVSVPSPASVIELKSDPVPVSVPPANAEVQAQSPVVSIPGSKTTVAVTHQEKLKPAEPEHHDPEPAPIVLATNTPRSDRPMDLDAVVPVKLPAIAATGGTPQIALPANTKAVPKLAAPPPEIRTAGYLIKKVAPLYPAMARNARIQGIVDLQLHITPEGKVDRIELLQGQPVLAGAAIDAVKQWRYEPARLNGNPVEMRTRVKLNFELPR